MEDGRATPAARLRACLENPVHRSSRRKEAQISAFVEPFSFNQSLLMSAATFLKHALRRERETLRKIYLFAVWTLWSAITLSTHAAVYQNVYNSGFANGGSIPDGNPTGWSDSRTLSGISDFNIIDVQVKLNISGGYNGDLYGYLSHSGVLVPLLNRVGVTA